MKNIPEMMKILKYSVLLAVWCSHSTVMGEEISSHKMVVETAENFVKQNISTAPDSIITIKANAIDNRINIPQCPLPLEASSNSALEQSNITVKVNCPSNDWFIYLVVKVNEVQPVVVPNTALSPGTILTMDNINVINVNKNRLRGSTYSNKEDLLGARIKRRSRPGHPISPNMLCFVCKGDSIVIVAKISGMLIKTSGIAEQDGNIGDTILVKNKRSNKKFNAKVISITHVEVHI